MATTNKTKKTGAKTEESKKESKTTEPVVAIKQPVVDKVIADPIIREALKESDEVADVIRQASEILSSHAHASPPMESYSRDGSVREKRVYLHGEKRALPAKRSGITVAAKIAGKHQLWLRTGEYPDGKLAEIFIDMYKEGSAFSSMLNMFAISISMGLQYGVPLEKFVENYVFTRFEPAGMTDHPNVKVCTSPIDFVFRILGMEYLGMTDFVQVKPKGIQKNKFENIARLAQTAMTQETLDMSPEARIDEAVGQVELPVIGPIKKEINNASDKALGDMMGDAPACPTCGHITVRNGSCYKCLNCGDSLGCS
jgi:ribonucleoside-diphosphate reductase alpha chain